MSKRSCSKNVQQCNWKVQSQETILTNSPATKKTELIYILQGQRDPHWWIFFCQNNQLKVYVPLEDEKETARNRMKYHVDKEAE